MTNVATSDQMNWVGAWYAAPTRMLSATQSGRTLRQIVHLHAGGEQLRLRLSNRYGDGPITLTSVSMGRALQGPNCAPRSENHALCGTPDGHVGTRSRAGQ